MMVQLKGRMERGVLDESGEVARATVNWKEKVMLSLKAIQKWRLLVLGTQSDKALGGI